MTYIKSREELEQATDRDIIQNFRHHLMSKSYGSENKIMDLYDNQLITDQDVEVARFLYDNRMATLEQLYREFAAGGVDEEKELQEHLHFLLEQRIVNFFTLMDRGDEDNRPPEDALRIYTFDFAGMVLLSHFYDDLDILNWNCRSLMLPGKYVKRVLLATDFRIALDTKLETPVLSYDAYRLIGFGRFRMVPQAEIKFQHPVEGSEAPQIVPFVMITCIEEDLIWVDKSKLSENLGRYEEWYNREAWRTYFQTAPGFFIVCDKDSTMNYAEDLVKDINRHENRERKPDEKVPETFFSTKVRVTTRDRFESDLSSCMSKYDPAKQKWVRVKIGLLKEKD